MIQGDEWKWMISKLSGNGSREEEELLTIWLAASRQNQVLFDEVTKLWKSSTLKLKLNNPATEEEWKKLQMQMQSDSKKSNLFALPQTWLAIAASLVILIGAIYYLRPAHNVTPSTPIVETQKQAEPDVLSHTN